MPRSSDFIVNKFFSKVNAVNTKATYDYDDLGQLISVRDDGVTTTYTYDTAGNIRQVSQDGTVVDTYTYGNNNWKDLLTAFNGGKIAYEGQTFNTTTGAVTGTPTSGNPISYFNGTRWNFTWANGRQLMSASNSTDLLDTEVSYTYDLNGLRTGKTVVLETYENAPAHSYVATVVAPTCTEDGYTLHECACGDSYQDNVVAALGHNWLKVTGTEVPYERCTRCGVTRGGVIIPPPVDPPVEAYSLGNGTAPSNACGSSERTLVSTVTEHHEYTYASGQLLRETITTTDEDGNTTTQTLDFTYDASSSPYALTYTNGTANPATYYYITNLQGDVIYLVSTAGATVAEYEYDPYGRVVFASGTMAEVNPLRYRRYCYDGETGFYYLQSRYYDPVICRFINTDGLASTGQGFLGYNMFAYCNNNPMLYSDASGYVIELAENATTEQVQQYEQAIEYLKKSSKGEELIETLESADEVITIYFIDNDEMMYIFEVHAILFDTNSGLLMTDGVGVQSAALGLAHEMGHAAQHLDGTYDEFVEKYKDFARELLEEDNLAKYETPIAKQLGEPTRSHYNDHNGVRTMNNSTHFIPAYVRPRVPYMRMRNMIYLEQ